METQFFFVLRERSTERLLPVNKVATRAEFGDGGPPRLFTRRQHAQQALDCWRQGQWHLTGDEDGCWPEPLLPKYNAEIAKRRQATEVDIVQMTLKETQPNLI
jgi:hypothetical protein